MRNYQKNATMTHRTEKKDLAGSFYETIFMDGAIHKSKDSAIYNFLSKGDDGMGGYLVPDSMEKKVVHALTENNVIRRLATVIHTDSHGHSVPLVALMSDAQWLDENEIIPPAEMVFSQVRFTSHRLGMMIQASHEAVGDGGIDVPTFLSETFGEQIASAEENAFLNGDGFHMPTGLLTKGSAETGVTAQAADTITAEEIISLYYSLDEKYRQHAVFMMHEDTAKALAERIYVIDDEYSASSRILLSHLRALALQRGYDIITCYCPSAPFEKIEHLFIPALSLGFMTSNRVHPLELEAFRTLHARRFTDVEALRQKKQRLSFNRKAAFEMLHQSTESLAAAKELHDELESHYVGHMDFLKWQAVLDRILKELELA